MPPGFWRRSACTAVAAGELARPLGLNAPDAFCLGLLSGIGQALLHHADPTGYAQLAAAAPERRALIEAERHRYGASHVAVSAAAVCLLVAGEVADRIICSGTTPQNVRHMAGGRVHPDEVDALVRRVPGLAADLVRAVTG